MPETVASGRDPGPQRIAIRFEEPITKAALDAELVVPGGADRVALLVQGGRASRCCARAEAVAHELRQRRFATASLELLTETEGDEDGLTGRYALDIARFARRLVAATRAIVELPVARGLPLCFFGAGPGAAAAIAAAAELPDAVAAIVSCGGRLDLIDPSLLERVRVPVLLVEGTAAGGCRAREKDAWVLGDLGAATERLPHSSVAIVPGAEHWFREPEVFPALAHLTAEWLDKHLLPAGARAPWPPRAAAGGAPDPVAV